MWGDTHRFNYNQQDRFVFYEHKCNFRLALMYFKSFLFPLNPWNFTSRSPANNEYSLWLPIRVLVTVRNWTVCSLKIDRQSAVYTFWDRLSFIEMPSHNRSVKSLSSSKYCSPIIPSMESIVRRHHPGKSWPCILVTAVWPARYDRLGILQLLWRSKKPFTMRAAFSKLTLENTSSLAALLSLALGHVLIAS